MKSCLTQGTGPSPFICSPITCQGCSNQERHVSTSSLYYHQRYWTHTAHIWKLTCKNLKRQINYSQLKKKKKGTTENNETEINNLSDTEFKILVVKMLTELRKIIDVSSACFNNEQEDIKTMQSDMANSITEFFLKNCIKNE